MSRYIPIHVEWYLGEFDSGLYPLFIKNNYPNVDPNEEIREEQFIEYLTQKQLILTEYPETPGSVVLLYPIAVTLIQKYQIYKQEYYSINSLRTQLDLVGAIENWYKQPLFRELNNQDLTLKRQLDAIDTFRHYNIINPMRYSGIRDNIGQLEGLEMVIPGVYRVDFYFNEEEDE